MKGMRHEVKSGGDQAELKREERFEVSSQEKSDTIGVKNP